MRSLLERELRDKEMARLFAQEELIDEATELIARTMNRNSVSKSELARRIGVTKPYISQLFSGSRNLTLRTFADLMHAMGHKVLLTSTSVSEDDSSGTMCWVVKAPRRAPRYEWDDIEIVSGAAGHAA